MSQGTTQDPLFETEAQEVNIPSFLAVLVPALEEKFLQVMGGWGMSGVIQADALPIIAHALDGYDDYPEEVQFFSEVPEVYIRLDMPPHTISHGTPEWEAALDELMEPIQNWRGSGKRLPTRWHYNWTFIHPDGERDTYGTITAKLRPDLSAWDVTLTEATA